MSTVDATKRPQKQQEPKRLERFRRATVPWELDLATIAVSEVEVPGVLRSVCLSKGLCLAGTNVPIICPIKSVVDAANELLAQREKLNKWVEFGDASPAMKSTSAWQSGLEGFKTVVAEAEQELRSLLGDVVSVDLYFMPNKTFLLVIVEAGFKEKTTVVIRGIAVPFPGTGRVRILRGVHQWDEGSIRFTIDHKTRQITFVAVCGTAGGKIYSGRAEMMLMHPGGGEFFALEAAEAGTFAVVNSDHLIYEVSEATAPVVVVKPAPLATANHVATLAQHFGQVTAAQSTEPDVPADATTPETEATAADAEPEPGDGVVAVIGEMEVTPPDSVTDVIVTKPGAAAHAKRLAKKVKPIRRKRVGDETEE